LLALVGRELISCIAVCAASVHRNLGTCPPINMDRTMLRMVLFFLLDIPF
jgi:hypothetical protein